jgi:phage-related protein
MLVGEVFARMGLDSKQYEKSLDRLEGITQKKAMTLGNIFRGAFSFAIGIGVIQGFRSLGDAITDFVNTAARTEVLDVAMMAVAKATGTSTREIRAQEEALRDLGIAKQEAKQMLTRFMQAELDVADVTKLARVAQDAAVIAGYNSSQAAEQMTEAIAKQRPELLSAFGFTKNLNEIYNDYAKTVNKTAKQLSEAEKKQAMLNYILAEGEKIAGTYEASMGAVGKIIGSLKRYWDDLKEAIAMPLALPPLKVIVDGITNALKNAISWAEANKAALQTWGQTAANVAGYIIRAFRYVGRIFTQNWALIRFVGTALLTYATATRIAAAATTIFKIASSVLKGTIAANVPILSALSIAINTYRLQVALAPVATNIFSAALYRLQAALYAVYAALGPIGWIILGLSAAVGVGTHLWGKYTQFVYSGAKIHEELAEGADQVGKSASDATGTIEDEADALKEAGKAAGKNLQSFDEVHQLQEDMAGSAEDLAESMGFDDIELGAPEAGGLEIPDIGAQLEEMKPTLAGFWEWIKLGASKVWESVKQKWSDFINWVKSWDVWDWLAQKWSGLKNIASAAWNGVANVISSAWAGIANITQTVWQGVWKLLQTSWSNAVKLATDVFGAIRDYVVGTWDNIKKTASNIWGAIWGLLKNQWETIKTFAINIFGTVRDLILGKIDLRTAVNQIWGEIKNLFFSSWSNIRDFGINIWTALRDFFINQWSLIQGVAIAIWTAIKDFLTSNWEATKEAATSIWTAIKDFFSQTWEAIKTAVMEYWNAILEFLGLNWEETKQKAAVIWQGIKDTITNATSTMRDRILEIWENGKQKLLELWEGIKRGAKEKWDGVKTVIKGAINGIIGFINKFIREFNKIEIKVPSINIPFVGTVGGWSVRVPQIPEIPMLAKGGLVTAPTLAMLGEAGPEAVIPLGRSGFADEIAQAVYQVIMDAIRISRASSPQSSDDKELVLKIDNTVLARMQLPALVREGQRQGIDLLPEVAIQTVGEVTDWITNLPEVAIQAVGEVTDWITNLPEIAIQAVGEVTDWITNLPEVAIQTVGEVTDWIISLPEVAVNATGRVTEWMFNPPEVFVDATGRIREWFVELPEVAIQAVGEVTDWITNLPEIAIQAVGEVTDWITNLPEIAIQAVGEVADWITNLPEVAIQTVGEVTEWMFSLPEVAVNATGRVMSWIVDLSTLAVNAVGYITEWVTNVPELETPIEAIARITKWVVDSIPDITLLGHIDLENIPIPITPISLNPPPQQIIQTPQFPQEGLQTVNTVRDDTHFADTVAQAVYRAIMDAARISQASAGGDDREIVLKIDNTTLARMQLPALTREAQRQGFDLVLRPQGV